jgi:RecJ-like exonuclease
MTMIIPVVVMDKDYEEETMLLPARYEVCPRCGGDGKHSNPAIDGNGFSDEIRADDPEFFEEYLEGRYDVLCTECGGKRVVPVVLISACTYAQKRALVRKRLEYRAEAEYRAEVRAERRALGIY